MIKASQTPPWRAWLIASRPKTLPAAVSPVVVGIGLAVADDVFVLLPALAALVGALLIQVGTNLANDYLDYVKGVDTVGRRGPTRVAQSGMISLAHLRAGIVLTFGLVGVLGLYLVAVSGWPILVVGIAALLSALAYSGGPYPFGYHGFGDLFVFLFFGLAAVCGTYYIQALSITPGVIAAAVPIGALTVAILVVNNLRDIETDRLTGKRTLAVIIGPTGTRLEYGVLLAVAYAVPVLFPFVGWSSAWSMLPWLTLPIAVRLACTISHTTDASALSKALAGTANLDLCFGLLLALGLLA